ncbi:hypothetical protein [Neptuniibacter marinus]|uniref:hypothetical protein n=1 Tax=Neptuniibacter marinus TaxID=1806670 RepID=UPI00082B7B24|nr:hypothetical protein [Neptuniibacter marinus]
MSSKLRLGEIAFDDDDFDHGFKKPNTGLNSRKRAGKSKRKKQDSDNYFVERSMKRGTMDNSELH